MDALKSRKLVAAFLASFGIGTVDQLMNLSPTALYCITAVICFALLAQAAAEFGRDAKKAEKAKASVVNVEVQTADKGSADAPS